MKKICGLTVLVVLMLGSAGCETVAIDQEPVENWNLEKLCDSIGNMRTWMVDHETNPHYASVVGEFRSRAESLYTKKEISYILDGKLFIGMTEAAMECAWGIPVDRKESRGTWGDHSEIIYGEERDGATVFTENGRITSWRSKD